MRVAIPKEFLNEEMEKFLQWSEYRKVSEDGEKAVFEGVFSLEIDFGAFGFPRGKRREFYDRLEVVGGRKALTPNGVSVTARRNKAVLLRLSKEEHELLKQYAGERGIAISDAARAEITRALLNWIKRKRLGKDAGKDAEDSLYG
jgi:hypothetical protein